MDEKTHILAGVTPLKSVGMARHMRDRISGLTIPQGVVDRLKQASDAAEEGVKICVETIQRLRATKGVHGVHVMAVAWEDIVPRVVEEAGLLPRPSVEAAGE